ncbi:uncharacterized protein EDB91DRAFT_1254676 [Suillus paluster]|uniref:uncharacterized protein n=1 Tax=Suillus paluster TaxID=48578 RepID=UPI001B871913|nr:uncharacterized protein EDB91DRAFT_1254676 [Suillus paluster]KAG1725628.1 hypothetical protein EDB91DRAFT_1254676 [Suillus paluster]
MQLSLVFTTLVSFVALAAAYPALDTIGTKRASLDKREEDHIINYESYGGLRNHWEFLDKREEGRHISYED